MENELERLQKQMKRIITDLCNEIGCDKCPDKWDKDCIASDTQNKILDIEMQDFLKKETDQ